MGRRAPRCPRWVAALPRTGPALMALASFLPAGARLREGVEPPQDVTWGGSDPGGPVQTTTFLVWNSAMVSASYPSPARTSSVCSPSSGAPLISGVNAENLIGLPTVRNDPRPF